MQFSNLARFLDSFLFKTIRLPNLYDEYCNLLSEFAHTSSFKQGLPYTVSAYQNLFADFYLGIGLILLIILSIFTNLSESKNYPSVYKLLIWVANVFLLNTLLLALLTNGSFSIFSSDIFITGGDAIIKSFLMCFVVLFFLYSYNYVRINTLSVSEYVVLTYFCTVSLSWFFTSKDVLSLYVLLEIQSFCFYLLTASNKHNQYSVESGLKYFILSSFSSIVLLFGFSLLYGLYGTTNLYDLQLCFSTVHAHNSSMGINIFCSVFILLALLFKMYAAPFHFWVSDIYQGAPSSTTAFFGTISSLPVFWIFCKLYVEFFYFSKLYLCYAIAGISISSMLLGLVGALYQKKIKRLIAFSSVTTVGYVLSTFIQDNVTGISNSLIYFFLYIINLTGIFCVFLNLYIKKNKTHLERLHMLSNFIVTNVWIGLFIIFLLFSAAGIPPFSLFIAKALILTNLSYVLQVAMLLIIIASALGSSFYYLRVIKVISFNSSATWIWIPNFTYSNSLLLALVVLFNSLFFGFSSYLSVLADLVAFTLF